MIALPVTQKSNSPAQPDNKFLDILVYTKIRYICRKETNDTMERIIITPKNEQEYSLVMEMLKKMRIKVAPAPKKALRRMTMDEFYAEIDAAEEAIAQGRTIAQEDMEKRVASWR